jgi:ATP-dependent DNA helicase RecQ
VLNLRRDILAPRAGAGAGARKKAKRAEAVLAAAEFEPDAATTALFDRLRNLRKRLASEAGVPPYVIFHDKTLALMAQMRPTSEAALLGISGVGQAKLERYGEAFIAEIRAEESGVGEGFE